MVEPYATTMRKNKAAWAHFQAQPTDYQKQITWWIVSAKKEETRLARLARLLEACSAGRRL
jgi:uncharacterized protein YdeI (YjbR/CyaY-like superfamily)